MLALRVAHPAQAVPPGRIGYDLRSSTLLVHSFVTPAGFDELSGTGALRCGDEHVDPVEAYAYDWMRKQVADKLHASPATWPIWLWAKSTRRELVAAAYRYARDDPGTVLLTCRLATERVLLSEYDEWHCVLNGVPVFSRSLTDAEFDDAFDAWHARFRALVRDVNAPRAAWPKAVLDELHESWKAIFDVRAYPRRSFWQGCVAELRTEDVVDAVRLELATDQRSPSSG